MNTPVSIEMKTLTITISDELAAHIETVRKIFDYDDIGAALEGFSGWLFENVATDPNQLFEEAETLEFESVEKLQAFAERARAHLPAGSFLRVGWSSSGDGFKIHLLRDEQECRIYDFALARHVDYETVMDFWRYLRVQARLAGESPKELPELLLELERALAERGITAEAETLAA